MNLKSQSLSRGEMKKIVGGDYHLFLCPVCIENPHFNSAGCQPWSCSPTEVSPCVITLENPCTP